MLTERARVVHGKVHLIAVRTSSATLQVRRASISNCRENKIIFRQKVIIILTIHRSIEVVTATGTIDMR